jgi:hypothetical protein
MWTCRDGRPWQDIVMETDDRRHLLPQAFIAQTDHRNNLGKKSQEEGDCLHLERDLLFIMYLL